MFAVVSVISFAVALILSIADAAVDFDFVILGLLLLAAHHAWSVLPPRRA